MIISSDSMPARSSDHTSPAARGRRSASPNLGASNIAYWPVFKGITVMLIGADLLPPPKRTDMTHVSATLALIVSVGLAAAPPSVAADVARGGQLARQWCANCHVVGNAPAATVQQGPPSFRAIAQGELTGDQLRTFLSHPHPPMPDLSLTRTEIDDLIEYIATLR